MSVETGNDAGASFQYGITCDDAETTATADFLSTRITDLEGSERGLRESRAHAAQCARTRARYADDAARWLAARR
jgi:hypothetical protein